MTTLVSHLTSATLPSGRFWTKLPHCHLATEAVPIFLLEVSGSMGSSTVLISPQRQSEVPSLGLVGLSVWSYVPMHMSWAPSTYLH